VLRRLSKQLACPRCGDIVADAEYRPWRGGLRLTSVDGDSIDPVSGAVQLRLVQQEGADSPVEAEARVAFVTRNLGELIYDIRCRRGHSTLRTAPQIARALRRTPGQWVTL
jgi:hypothetical protein